MRGGETFVAKCPSYRVADVVEAIGPSCRVEEIGIRPGEKMHEDMILPGDSPSTVDLGRYYAILPSFLDHEAVGERVPSGFGYNSRTNDRFLAVEEIRELVRTQVDPSFRPA
jgi:UDP-N-acetylglucosamine 4,6-dehydratase/5-epimerase